MVAAHRVAQGPRRARVGNGYLQTFHRGLAFADSVALILAFGAASLVALQRTEGISLAEFLAIRIKLTNILIFAGMIGTWRLTFTAAGLYDPGSRSQGRRVLFAAGANLVNTAAIGLAALMFQISMVSPAFLAVFWIAGTGLVLALRNLAAALIPDVGRTRNVLVVGTGESARRYADRVEDGWDADINLIGFCDDRHRAGDEIEGGYGACVTDFKNFPDFIKSNVVDEVVICVPTSVLDARDCPILPTCESLGVTMRFLGGTFGVALPNHEEVVVSVYHGLIESGSLMVKRSLDVTVATLLLVASTPLLLLVAGLIRIDSQGPILFQQTRIGLNRRPFRMYKLRTMCEDAETLQPELEAANEVDGAAFKISDDPRITRVGRFLRRSSLDELPQLLNVLRGDMSLVGPRPLPLRDFDRFDVEEHGRRFAVYPGITGLWQVSGRSSLSFADWMELDLQYVDRWSVLLDLELLLRTIPAVLLRIGAR